jgi:hypothetical protein
MGFSWITWHYLTDEQYKGELAKRQAEAKKRGAEDSTGTRMPAATQSLN